MLCVLNVLQNNFSYSSFLLFDHMILEWELPALLFGFMEILKRARAHHQTSNAPQDRVLLHLQQAADDDGE